MTPSLLSTRSRHARPWSFLAGLMAAVAVGIGASASLLAQQPAAGPAPRRAAAPAKASPGRQQVTASTSAAKRGTKGTASSVAVPRSRAPAGTRASAGAVQQTSATVAADGGVVLAGGATALADCRQCGRQECAKCRPGGGRLGLPCNGLCEQGGCPAHCPVRPDQFGYYATRWRSWPGQGVKQVGHFDPATTPVVPPRSEVPSMEDELALPSQRDEAPAEEEGDEEEEEAMTEGESDAAGTSDAAADDTQPAATKPADGASNPAEAKADLPAGKPSAPSSEGTENEDVKSGEKAVAPAKASGLLDTSGADASRAGGSLTGGAWSNWARASAPELQPMPTGSVVRTSGPAESMVDVSPSDDRRESPKLRSPAQRMVEGSDRALGRWRAKAAASEEALGDAAANPLRGVTAQPGNPLR